MQEAPMKSILKPIISLNNAVVETAEFQKREVTRHGKSFKQTELRVHIRPFKSRQNRCPKCGKRCSGYDTKRTDRSWWRAPNLNGIPVYLGYRPRRIECPEHGVLTEDIPWADGNSRFTVEFNNEIAWLVTKLPKTDIAEYMIIDWKTVGNCVKAAHARLEPDVSDRMRGLKKICVDETSYTKGRKYITVVYDMDRNRVVWAAPGNSNDVFGQFCKELSEEERKQIEIVAGDGARWIDSCVKEYFPNATRCIDSFHVNLWATEALDKVRISTYRKATRELERQQKEFEEENDRAARAQASAERFFRLAQSELDALAPHPGRPSSHEKRLREFVPLLSDAIEASKPALQAGEEPQPVKRGRPSKADQFTGEQNQILGELKAHADALKWSKHALGHSPENRYANQSVKIALIQNSDPDLYRAYQLKEGLRLILHLGPEDNAEEQLDKWIEEALDSGIKPMQKLAENIKRDQRENILNSIRLQANSARSEATNTTIKSLIKMARGFRDQDNMIALIFLKCGDLDIPLANRVLPTSEDRERIRKQNKAYRKARIEKKQAEFRAKQEKYGNEHGIPAF